MEEIRKYYKLNKQILVSLINAGTSLIGVIVASSLMKFYTDMVGLSPVVYGSMYLIFSIWNAINDPIIGYWADNRPYKNGKYAPLMRKSIPIIAISIILLFFASPTWSETITAIYLLVLLVVYEGAQTMMGVSFNAFKINTFFSMKERTKLQIIASYIIMLPVFLGGMIPIWFLTGDYSHTTVAIILSGIVLIGILFMFIGTRFVKEHPEFYEKMETTKGLKELMKLFLSLIKDKTFLLFILSLFFINVATGNYFAGYIYYMDNVLLVEGLKATIPDILTGIIQMASFPLIVMAVKRHGSKSTLIFGMFIAMVGHTLLTFPLGYYAAATSFIVMLLGYGFYSAIVTPMQGLIVDNIELQTGKRQPGVIGGLMAVLLIPSTAVQPLILSTLLTASGYVGSSKVQTQEVVNAIRLGVGIIPASILLIGIVLLMFLPLSKKREMEIQSQIEAKYKGDNNEQ